MAHPSSSPPACSIQKCRALVSSLRRRLMRGSCSTTRQFWIWAQVPACARYLPRGMRALSWRWVSTKRPCAAAAAVRGAGSNARLNHLEHKIDVRQGDLFAPVQGEKFDLILFNPPFLRGAPADDRDRAWRSSDVAERFVAGLREHLRPGGSALVLLSTFGDGGHFLHAFRERGFGVAVFAERRFVNERLTVFRVVPLEAEPCRPVPVQR